MGPRQYTRWTPQLDNTIRDNAHLGKNAVASILGCNVASVTTRASHLGVSLKIRELTRKDTNA